jgi:hypothetical protein
MFYKCDCLTKWEYFVKFGKKEQTLLHLYKQNKINIANLSDTSDVRITLYSPICDNKYKVFLVKNASNAIVLILNTMQSVDY